MKPNWSVGTKIASGYAVSVVILVIIGTLAYRGMNALVEVQKRVTLAYSVEVAESDVLTDLVNAETAVRGYLLTREDDFLDLYDSGIQGVAKDLPALQELTLNTGAQEKVRVLRQLVDDKEAFLSESMNLARSAGDWEAATALVKTGKGDRIMDEIRAALVDVRADADRMVDEHKTVADAAVRATRLTLSLGCGLSVLILAGIGLLITRNISAPLQRMSRLAERITDGDLTGDPPATARTDEVGVLSRAFRVMLESLRELNRQIQESVNALAEAATEILITTTQTTANTTETASAVSQSLATIEEIKTASELSAQRATFVAEMSRRVAETAVSGVKVVGDSLEGMNRIKEQVDFIGQSVVRLSEQNQDIAEIVTSANDLASQSNLLAVNAAIEAAKAGEQGRGFAVVAREVKSLADQSKQATEQVKSIVGEIQKAVSSAAMAAEQSSRAVDDGVKLSEEAGGAIRKLSDGVTEAGQAAEQIAASIQQQSADVAQVVQAIVYISQATSQNAASAKQVEASARNLHDLGHRLNAAVSHYKV